MYGSPARNARLGPGVAVSICAGLLLALAGCGGSDDGGARAPAAKDAPAKVSDVGTDPGPALPRVLDLGRGTCVPCRRMAPILEALAEVYEGRAVIEVVDIGKPRGKKLAETYGVRLIPTQIFLDADGDEVWRHEGFLPREGIVRKLTEMGVEAP